MPTPDQLHLRLDAIARPQLIELFDVLGRRVLTRSVGPSTAEHTLSLTTLPTGVYSLRVRYATGGVAMRHLVRE